MATKNIKNKAKILLLDLDLLVSDTGVVYTKNGSIKKQFDCNGYLQVKYKKKNYFVHRLVAQAFLPNPDDKSDVNHKDGDKRNNFKSNLEWATRSENIYHSLRSGLHANPELPVVGTDIKTGSKRKYVSLAEAARKTLAQQPNTTKCLKGERNSAGGCTWEINYA